MPAIALGTVQFGLDYGATNRAGQISLDAAHRILQTAQDGGIRWLDTAAAYGDAEERLGSVLDGDPYFSICSKLAPARDAPLAEAARRSLDNSLTRLRRPQLEALLVHAAADLLGKEGDALWDSLSTLRDQGLARSIGVSVYEAGEIEAIVARYKPDWIQLPCSVLDQRLVQSGVLARLNQAGIRVQARSLLLQGLVCADPDALPEALTALRPSLQRLRNSASSPLSSPLAMALAWAASQQEIELAVLGVTRREELQQCLDEFIARPGIDWPAFACNETELLDPRKWPAGVRLS